MTTRRDTKNVRTQRGGWYSKWAARHAVRIYPKSARRWTYGSVIVDATLVLAFLACIYFALIPQ
jgi:hypothetical protein